MPHRPSIRTYVNRYKPESLDQFALMALSTEDYVQEHIDNDKEVVVQHLQPRPAMSLNKMSVLLIIKLRMVGDMRTLPSLFGSTTKFAVCEDWQVRAGMCLSALSTT